MRKPSLLILFSLISCGLANGQTMSFEEYEPKSTLVVPEHKVSRARFPIIDVHSHHWRMNPSYLDSVVSDMDKLNVAVSVNLSGRGFALIMNPEKRDLSAEDAFFETGLDNVDKVCPGRMLMFTNISYVGIDDPDWTRETVKQIETDVRRGAKGLKIYKDLGLTLKYKDGRRVPVDDPKLDPI